MAAKLHRLFGSTKKSSLRWFVAPSTFSVTTRNYSEKQGIFQKLMGTADPHKSSHSKLLTDNKVIYEIQFEQIKPEFKNEFIQETSSMHAKLSNNAEYPGKLVGSWTTVYGDLDEAVHIWAYDDGYKGAAQGCDYLDKDKEYEDFCQTRGKWLRSRSNQILQEFSFWGSPEPRLPSHIYELRSYTLKPGTMIEWGNKWGHAIQIRRKDAVGGFFSQIGELYQVHYIWAYDNLSHRKHERELMWNIPGWDDLVAGTVPLIRSMEARILKPVTNSPLQ